MSEWLVVHEVQNGDFVEVVGVGKEVEGVTPVEAYTDRMKGKLERRGVNAVKEVGADLVLRRTPCCLFRYA